MFSENAFYSDFDNNLDLITLINSEPLNFEKIHNFFYPGTGSNQGLVNNYIEKANQYDHVEMIGDYETLKAITREEFYSYYERTFYAWTLEENYYDFDFPIKIPLSNSAKVYEKLPNVDYVYKEILKLLTEEKKIQIEDIDQRQLKSAFTSILIGFDYFDIYENTKVSPTDIITWFKENINFSNDLLLFYSCFKNITYKHNPNFIKTLMQNYKKIDINKFVEKKFDSQRVNMGKLNRILKNFDISDFEDLYNRYYLKYDNCTFSLVPIEDKLIHSLISQETFNRLQDSFLGALEKKGSSLPYLTFENEVNKFDMYKSWDPNLVILNVENKYKDIGIDKLCDAISNNKRIIEITNKNNGAKSYAILNRTQSNDLNIEIRSENDLAARDLQQLITNIENSLDKTDRLNNIYVNNELFKSNGTNIRANIEYVDTPIYIDLNYNNDRDLFDKQIDKINNIFQKAFFESHAGNYQSEASQFLVGRDWVLQFSSSGNEILSLEVVARYNEKKANKLGSKEMLESILSLGKSYDNVVCTAHSTSYYMIAKWASEGKIFIKSDIQERITREGGLMSFSEPTGVYYISEEGYSTDFSSNVITRSSIDNTKKVHNIVFKVVDQNNINMDEIIKLEEQKSIYTEAVVHLTEEWDKEKNQERFR